MTMELMMVDVEKLAALLRKAAVCLRYGPLEYERVVGKQLDVAADELEKKKLLK